jgi:hypothetical protein
VPDNAFLVDDEGGAAADEAFLIKHAVGSDRLSFDVTEQGETHTYIFLKALVGGKAVNADAYDLRVALFEVSDISLICLQFFRSTPCEGQHVEGQGHVLFATEVTEFNGLSIRVSEREIWSHVPDMKMCLRGGRLLGGCSTITVHRV